MHTCITSQSVGQHRDRVTIRRRPGVSGREGGAITSTQCRAETFVQFHFRARGARVVALGALVREDPPKHRRRPQCVHQGRGARRSPETVAQLVCTPHPWPFPERLAPRPQRKARSVQRYPKGDVTAVVEL